MLRIPVGHLGAGVMAGIEPTAVSAHVEFWPFRNQLLITLGAMHAIRHGHSKILIGTVKTDNRHVDGSAGFVDAITHLVRLQEGGVVIEAPAIALDSVELVRVSGASLPTLAWAHSCHTGTLACGACPGCTKHSLTKTSLGMNR